MKYFTKILQAGFVAAMLIFWGCSSTASSVRYGKKSDDNSGFADRYKTKDTVQTKTKDLISHNQDASSDDTGDDPDIAPVPNKRMDLFDAFPDSRRKSSTGISANFADVIESMKMAIVKYEATPYQYGGNDLDGIDCSAFTQNVYQQAYRHMLPRSAREQYQVGEPIDREGLKFGDLVFFNTRRRVRPGHVGIYIGDNKFVHASRHLGVVVSSLEEDYYQHKYMGARRMIDLDNFQTSN